MEKKCDNRSNYYGVWTAHITVAAVVMILYAIADILIWKIYALKQMKQWCLCVWQLCKSDSDNHSKHNDSGSSVGDMNNDNENPTKK